MTRMQPKGICVRDFIQPFRVRTASVNLDRQTESRDQDRLICFKILGMNVAGDVSRNCAFRPAPISECLGKEFEFAAWRRKAAFDFAVNLHTHYTTAV